MSSPKWKRSTSKATNRAMTAFLSKLSPTFGSLTGRWFHLLENFGMLKMINATWMEDDSCHEALVAKHKTCVSNQAQHGCSTHNILLGDPLPSCQHTGLLFTAACALAIIWCSMSLHQEQGREASNALPMMFLHAPRWTEGRHAVQGSSIAKK